MTRECIYCGDANPERFSDEHIWPRTLGGENLSGIWRSDDVCAKCNSIAGMHVDSGFSDSFFGRASAGFDDESIAALGELISDEIPKGFKVSVFVGADGFLAYHIRAIQSDDQFETRMVGNPKSKIRKKARLLLWLPGSRPNDEATAEKGLHMALKRFKYEQIIVANCENITGIEAFNRLHIYSDSEHSDLSMLVRSGGNGGTRKCQIQYNILADQRFMAKVALGLGANLFGSKFLKSDRAKQLRKAWRERDLERFQSHGVSGIPFVDGSLNELGPLLSREGFWTLWLTTTNNTLCFFAASPSGHVMGMPIASLSEFELLESLDLTAMPAWVLDNRADILMTTIPDILANLSQDKLDNGLNKIIPAFPEA